MRARLRALVVVLGLVAPVGTLAFGWSYASIRETRLKERVLAAPAQPGVARHFRWEMLGLSSLMVLLATSGLATWQAFRRTEELARERAMFVSAVSHELRTPLTTLRMHAEMLTEGLVGEERKPRVYGELLTETARLSRLIENVLEAARIGEGRRPVRRVNGDLRAAVQEAVTAMQRTIEMRGFTVALTAGPPVPASFDPAALSIVVHNLLDNALKYAAECVPREVQVSVFADGDQAVLQVRDHGPGIPPGERARVFERFYRVADPDHAHRPGTGLGLSLVRELTAAHGGSAQIVPSQGPGTTVEVRLPPPPSR
jgi:signal transduction histidine kinase